MNAITERRLRTCRRELLDRTLTGNQRHLLRALREYEHFHNTHRPHQGMDNARPLRALPPTKQRSSASTSAGGNDWGGIPDEYHHVA